MVVRIFGHCIFQLAAWVGVWSRILLGRLSEVCHCSALFVIPSRDSIYRLCIQNYGRCTEQKNRIAKRFSFTRHFLFPRVFDVILGEGISFGIISQRLFCNWAGFNPNSVYFCVSGSLSCTVQNTQASDFSFELAYLDTFRTLWLRFIPYRSLAMVSSLYNA